MRRTYIDWLRGLAVVIMIEAHTIDSWTAPASRTSATFHWLQFLAGWAAPLFLLLAGVSIVLSAQAKQRKTPDPSVVRRALVRRGWQVFGIALLFRLQSFALTPGTNWRGIFKPDVLNVMGLAMVVGGFCWSRGQTRLQRAFAWLLPAAVIVVCAAWAVNWTWPHALPTRLEAYIRTNGFGTFALLPWAAFVLVGGMLGETIASPRSPTEERTFHLRLGLAGIAIAGIAWMCSFIPSPFSGSLFWHTSITWFSIRVGVMCVMLSLAWLWMQRPRAARWSPMVVFGRTSLFVYWIHVELVYGFFTHGIQHELSLVQVLAAYAAFTTAMLGLAVLWSRRERGPWIPESLKADFTPARG